LFPRRPAWLAQRAVTNATVGEELGEPAKLGRLPRTLAALEDDEPAAVGHGCQPSVMIELVAPFSIPSTIQSFTRAISLSKFSCAATSR